MARDSYASRTYPLAELPALRHEVLVHPAGPEFGIEASAGHEVSEVCKDVEFRSQFPEEFAAFSGLGGKAAVFPLVVAQAVADFLHL